MEYTELTDADKERWLRSRLKVAEQEHYAATLNVAASVDEQTKAVNEARLAALEGPINLIRAELAKVTKPAKGDK